MSMKFIIPGGSGQVGTILARAHCADGHEVEVLSRKRLTAPWTAKFTRVVDVAILQLDSIKNLGD